MSMIRVQRERLVIIVAMAKTLQKERNYSVMEVLVRTVLMVKEKVACDASLVL